MFKPTASAAEFARNEEATARSIIKDALFVMNFLKFSKEYMRKFKSGVIYSARINGALYSINYDVVKAETTNSVI